jgi:hypothetical protein
VTIANSRGLSFGFLQIFFRRRRLFVPVIVVVIASPASDLGGLSIHQRHNRMISDPAAFHAVIVDHVS